MAIAQDHDGFIWLATIAGGLIRYDGYEFRPFTSDPLDPQTLSDNHLRVLLVDREGFLWIGTWASGLNRYDPRTQEFTHYRHDPSDPNSLSDDHVGSLLEDREGNLWVGTLDGLNKLDRRAGRFHRYLLDGDSRATTSVYDLVEARDGHFWAAVYGVGLYELVEGEVVARFQSDPRDPKSLTDDRVYRLAMDEMNDTLWVATWGGGLDAFDTETRTFRDYRYAPNDASSLPSDTVQDVFVDREGFVWVLPFDGGLARLHRGSGEFARYTYDPRIGGTPSEALSVCLFEDAAGSLWRGTHGKGVEIWDRRNPVFFHYRHVFGVPNGLSDDLVLGALEDTDGILWIGTGGGLDRLDPATRTINSYRYDPAKPDSLAANFVFELYEDEEGSLWIGTWGGGLNRLDRRTGKIERYPCGPSPESSTSALRDCDVRAIYEDEARNLWVGTATGLHRLDRESGRFTRYVHDPTDDSSLTEGAVQDIVEDAEGNLWVGTMTGLNRWLSGSRRFMRYELGSTPTGPSHNDVNVLLPARDGRLWLGTGAGLDLVSLDTEGHPRFEHQAGFPSASVEGIVEDDEGVLWIKTTANGLRRFDLDTLSASQIDFGNGLSSPSGNNRRNWKMKDGRLLLDGVDGLVILDPTTVRPNTHVPPVVITRIAIDNQPVPEVATSTGELTMRPRARSVSFDFAALDFRAPEKNRYRFQLEGLDEGWTEVDASRRLASYTNLAPGRYVFRVKGSNNEGLWNEHGASVVLTVMPAWWQTVWFRVAGALSVLAFFFLVHRLRLKYIVESNRQLESEIEERQKAEAELRMLSGRLVMTQEQERRRVARELHDGVNQRLAMLSMRLGVLAHRPPENTQETSRQFEELKTAALELSRDVRDVSHRLHSSELEHLGLVHALRAECARVEKESGMEVDLDADEGLALASSDPALCLYRVAQETLMNAVRHSHASLIRVQLAAANGGLELVVSDDGVGFDVRTGARNGGLGLTSMAERLRYLGGRLTVDSHSREGTEVRAWLPLETAFGAEGSS